MSEEKLLLLSCCAPCSCGVIKKLAGEKRRFAVLFYNPNIDCTQEYEKRLKENKRVCEQFGVPFVSLPYEPEIWRAATAGLEQEPERGKRCSACFEMRLLRAARYAKENGFDVFSSVLGVSRHKDLAQVNEAASCAEEAAGVPYDRTNWRKGGVEELRHGLIREMELYNQRYCGCAFSRARGEKNEENA